MYTNCEQPDLISISRTNMYGPTMKRNHIILVMYTNCSQPYLVSIMRYFFIERKNNF